MNESIDVHKVFAEYFKGCETLAYAVSSRLGEGNMCIDINEYASSSELIAENPFFTDKESFLKQTEEGDYVTYIISDDVLKPFIIHNGKAYLQRYFRYETDMIRHIKRLKDNFHIITGGPGSGKTYSVSMKLIDLCKNGRDLKVALAAPTGKAAVRMNESIKKFVRENEKSITPGVRDLLTGLEAQTVHRLLGYRINSVFFAYNEKNKLPYDVVIVDECSMVDGAMMTKLLEAVSDSSVLYLIGDRDQLASVEAGSVFGDLCRSEKTEVMNGKVETLEGSRRFTKDAGIWKISQDIIGGKLNDITPYGGNDQVTIDTEFSNDLFEKYALMYSDYILEDNVEEALKKLYRIRFLCVTRTDDQSVAEYNKKIQYFLSRKIEGFHPRSERFYHNQPIMITSNDYKLGIFNGDVGIVREKEIKGRKVMMASFETTDGKVREIQAGFLNHYQTVFAMTIHKSQGSEFENVVVVLPLRRGKKLLTRELLYTGVTRAIKKVLIQSPPEVITECAGKSVMRASGLETRLLKE